ncbi:MAG: IS630 family transposase, partial [Verrucomicrobia bacterium]|nr:IS630 family transposase [Verrucomicrobiota bacterium]
MARTRRNLDEQGEGDALRERLRQQRPGWQRERLLAVQWGWEGELSLEQIAAQLGRARSSIQLWFDAFRRGGVEALLSLKRGKGPPSQLRPEMAQALAQQLQSGRCRRAADVHRWLRETYGLQVGLASVYHYLKKLGARLKVPRPCHEKHDPAAAEAFKATLGQTLLELQVPLEKPVRLWVADEMRYGLQPVTRRVWALRGQRVVVPVRPGYQWGYVFGALQVGGCGQAAFLYCPSVTRHTSRLFLRQLAAREPEAIHVVLWDGAGFHPEDGAPRLPANVRLVTLPPYSPQLNPI